MFSQLLNGRLAWAPLALALASCSAPESIQPQAERIVGGTPTNDAHASVVYVMTEVGTFNGSSIVKIGSGTLVAPNLVITALHVLSRNPSNVPFTCDATGNDVSGSQGSMLGPQVAADKVSIFDGPTPSVAVAHGARIISSGSATICENDLAFVVLDQPLVLPVVPIRREQAAQLGDALTAVGYGGEHVEPTLDVTRTQADVHVTAVGQWIRTFTVSEGPCEGDSGGPALSAEGELVGVFSTVGVECTGPNAAAKYTDLSFFSPLIQQAFEVAGAGSPWATPEAGSGGEPPGEVASGAGGMAAAGQPTASADAGDAGDSGCSIGRVGAASPWLLAVMLGLGLMLRRVGERRRMAPPRARLAQETARVV